MQILCLIHSLSINPSRSPTTLTETAWKFLATVSINVSSTSLEIATYLSEVSSQNSLCDKSNCSHLDIRDTDLHTLVYLLVVCI